MQIAIIDYQLSNLFSIKHVCDYLSLESIITSKKEDILNADAAILPGVGAFHIAMNNLEELELIIPIKKFINSGKPFMGVCLGMQLLFRESLEFNNSKGLDIIPGRVIKFDNVNENYETLKIPHVGWNQITKPKHQKSKWKHSPLSGIQNNENMYFVHSYFVVPENDDVVLTTTNYGGTRFCSSILFENVFATQFHPEKSSEIGIQIYKRWVLKNDYGEK
jgi:glutamine amidotransferase